MVNEQQPATPYNADNLIAHDKGLIWAREFGTNTTLNVGNPVQTPSGGPPAVPAAINARTGMLEVNSLQAANALFPPRGNTFLMPDWTKGPLSPVLGPDVAVAVLFAHTLYLQQPVDLNVSGMDIIDRVSLLLGQEAFVGNDDIEDFQAFSIIPNRAGAMNAASAFASQDDWDGGGQTGSPVGQVQMDHFGCNLYWRFIMASDGVKQTDFFIAVSQDGMCWTPIGSSTIGGVVRRVGLGVGGFCLGALDWARLYSYVIEDCPPTGFAVPLPPITGGRLYVP